ncbi:CatB-related O-acetyltransferase [Lysinibacillus sp. NPDC097287]|uniref:CatB-related O-acetyltransferase n=1 Tax=Lysinibacillus sp. NPDC097287 TaxID=3364144 RepID=UPI003802E437
MTIPLWKKQIDDIICNNFDKSFAVFGTGSASEKVMWTFGILESKIKCFFDNNNSSKVFYGKPLYSIEQLHKVDVDIIIIASQWYDDIEKQIRDIDSNILIFSPFSNKVYSNNKVKIGRYTYGANFETIARPELINEIGSFCSINKSVKIGTEGNHPIDLITTHPLLYREKYSFFPNLLTDEDWDEYNGKITIGNDVWIGANVVILPGVSIHDGAIIAAGAIVTKDVPPYAIVGGVPAKLIRYRFNETVIKKLLIIKWWNWDDGKIKNNLNLFLNPEQFVEEFFE